MAEKKKQSPLYNILNEINQAASSGFPFLAIAVTVALPDICVSLASEDGRSDGKRYKEWCKNNLIDEDLSYVTPDDLWSMRCGVLHNGRFGDLQHNVGRVIFALPGSVATFVNCQANDAYIYSVVRFCRKFTDAVHAWYEANRNDPKVASNTERLMQYRNDEPLFVGMTVLA